jgi:fumarate hydratase subunit beta
MTQSNEIKLNTPFNEDTVNKLHAGDKVLLTGVIYTARDQAHKRICKAIESGDQLPFDIKGQVIYFVGPTPAPQNQVIGAAGPTTSSRMDPFTPVLLRAGLKATIGKGYRNDQVAEALQKYNAVHLSAIGGAGALLGTHITSAKIIAYEDLQTEAIRKLTVKDFPAVVAYDSKGGCVYKR